MFISVIIDIMPNRQLIGFSWERFFKNSFFSLNFRLAMKYHMIFDNAGFHFDFVAQKVLVVESTNGFDLVFMSLKRIFNKV